MIVLGFDTATPVTTVALYVQSRGEVARELRHEPSAGERPGHATQLLVLAAELLDEAQLQFGDVERIAVGLGPGTFTGLRIGVATARALAQSTGAELVGVSTLRALACVAEASAPPGSGVLAVIDARRGEVFAAGWREGSRVIEPAALAPERLAQVVGEQAGAWLAVGDGALRSRTDLEGAGCSVPADGNELHGVSARAICGLALQESQGTVRDLVVPDYLRPPDAVPVRKKIPPVTDGQLEIRGLTYADLPQIIAIERRAFPTPWSLAMFVLELSKPSGVCLAALKDGRMLGYLVCSRYDTVWHIMNVAVDPDERRAGVATALLLELFVRIDAPQSRITLEVRESNRPAIALYERYGFRAAGRRRRYYQDNGEDAVIMWRTKSTLAGHLDDVPNASPA